MSEDAGAADFTGAIISASDAARGDPWREEKRRDERADIAGRSYNIITKACVDSCVLTSKMVSGTGLKANTSRTRPCLVLDAEPDHFRTHACRRMCTHVYRRVFTHVCLLLFVLCLFGCMLVSRYQTNLVMSDTAHMAGGAGARWQDAATRRRHGSDDASFGRRRKTCFWQRANGTGTACIKAKKTAKRHDAGPNGEAVDA